MTSSVFQQEFPVKRGMVQTSLGALGYLICQPSSSNSSSTTPRSAILCFHASPRNSDEYLEVLPLLAAHGSRTVVALDMPGYGISENPPHSCSIDDIADAFLQVASTLGIEQFITLGNLMGNFPAVSLAARYPDKVKACVLTNLYFWSLPQKKKSAEEAPPTQSTSSSPTSVTNTLATTVTMDEQPTASPSTPSSSRRSSTMTIPDSFQVNADGSHLLKLHNKRPWLDTDLNLRVVQGELTYLVNRRQRYQQGISIQDLSSFDFPTPAQQTQCPTLCVKGQACVDFFDQIGYHGTRQFEQGCAYLGQNNKSTLEGPRSTLNLLNQMPDEFAKVCIAFLEKHDL